MSEYFKDKVAAVTGAASGIGLGLVEKLLAEGAMAVFMGDINQDNLTKESERLNQEYPGKVHTMLTDVTKLDQVEALINGARAHDGHPRLRLQQRRSGDDHTHRTGDLRYLEIRAGPQPDGGHLRHVHRDSHHARAGLRAHRQHGSVGGCCPSHTRRYTRPPRARSSP